MRLMIITATVVAAVCVTSTAAAAAPTTTATPAKETSTYLAGYRTSQVGISRASASFTVPTVTCDPGGNGGVQFGIGNEPAVSQLSLLAGVRINCQDGTPQYFAYAFGTAERQVVLISITPGDRFNVLITQTQRSLTATATDLTAGFAAKITGSPKPDNTLTFGAFALESGITPLPVPDFGTVLISKPVLENTGLAAWSPTLLTRRNGTTTQIATSAFQANGAFRLTWKAAG